MPNTGKPSGACQNCKQKHAKCDEARPACTRCVKLDRKCPGYPEGFDLVLRNQNEVAKASVARRQRASHKARAQHIQSQSSSRVSFPGVSTFYLTESEALHSLYFFLQLWVLYPRDPQSDRGFIQLLPMFLAGSSSDSPLSLCVDALSFCVFQRWERKVPDAETPRVRRMYGDALAATRRAVHDPVVSLSDETLMAVCLLGTYEEATHAYKGKLSSAKHFNGAVALIKQRQGGVMTDLSKRILLGVRNAIVSRAVSTSVPVDIPPATWDKDDQVQENPATLLDLMRTEVANLAASAQSPTGVIGIVEDEVDHVDQTPNLLARAKAIDAQLLTWPQTIPQTWVPIKIGTSEVPQSVIDAGVYGNSCEIHADVTICSIWNDWRVARMKVLTLVARIGDSKTQAQAANSIQQLVDDICATIPFMLGSRTEPTSMYTEKIDYPSFPGQKQNLSHHQAAAAYGGWHMYNPIQAMIDVAKFLRNDQVRWIQKQGKRLAEMYDVHLEDG